ncbi:sugar transferase [Mycobacterium sp. NBC_00419]|uniref:sugar transferase n=1 Tax=Mycobacterium sp. NBC_00419 TaxID=2975989 RepID=UPI0030DED275
MVARSTRSFEPTTPAPVHSARPDRRSFAALIRQDPLSTAVTIGIDVVSATVALALVIWWTVAVGAQLPPTWMLALFVPATIAVMATRGIYRRRLNRRFIHEVGPVVATVALASMVLLSGLILAHVPENPEQFVLRAWICATAMILTGRLIRATVQRRLRLRRHLLSPTLIVGNGIVAHQIIERLLAAPEHGLDPIGLLDTDSPWHPDHNEPVAGVRRIGAPETIEQAILDTGAEAIVIAFSRTQDELLARVVRLAHATGSRVWVVPRMFDVIGERSTVEHVGGLPLLSLPRTDPRGWQFTVKHVFDQVCGTVGLVLISPLFLTLMALVRLSSPGPIFFRQPRVGRDGRVFDCLKFRTMRLPDAADGGFELGSGTAPGGVEGVDRRTRIGRIMRSTSLDELPQLINVVKGEMSLVGPRPERPEYVEVFEAQIRRYGERHRVKAGMTGWAQVHGLRGQTSITDRAEWDNFYIENWSLALDVKILALTVLAVLRRSE